MATTADYALLASDVYKEGWAVTPEGWSIVDRVDKPESGLYAKAYKNDLTDEIVVSFRGTDGYTDALADIDLGLGIETQQLLDARVFYENLRQNNLSATITATGHSLGGAIVQYVSAVEASQGRELSGTTFGAPSISNVLDGVANVATSTLGQIINFVHPNDPVYLSTRALGEHIGEVRFTDQFSLSSVIDDIALMAGNILEDGILSIFNTSFSFHYMDGYQSWANSGAESSGDVAGIVDSFLTAFGLLSPAGIALVGSHLTGNPGNPNNTPKDPFVLDLDGDGIELMALDSVNPLYFDIDADLFQESVGWVGPDDGLLAMDLNGNGKIDDITELFGDATTNAFDDLALLDSNGDGVISNLDAEFSNLKVWQDLNSNGTTEAGELQSLTAAGISSISLSATTSNTEINGNVVTRTGSFTRTDGTTGTAASVDLLASQVDAQSTATWGPHQATAELLFNVRGYGSVASLQNAMSHDEILLNQVLDFVITPNAQISTYRSQVESILFKWAGVENVDPATHGVNIDGRILAALESFQGVSFVNTRNPGQDPSLLQAQQMEDMWDDFISKTTVRMSMQGNLSTVYSPLQYDVASGDVVGTIDAASFMDGLLAQVMGAASTNVTETTRQAAMQGLVDVIDFADLLATNVGLTTTDLNATFDAKLFELGIPLNVDEVRGLNGTVGLTSSLNNEAVVDVANEGNLLTGGQWQNVMWGGAGNDVILNKNVSNDIFIFNLGDDRELRFG
ncbi:MAG: hypothetical protein COB46_12920 [Rhodospirillaceae bacterium]|nr:MAG: hypothetical protein COB46_12920 [Rhodospirillaceae bacterium]